MLNHRRTTIDSALQGITDSLGIELLRQFMSKEHDHELSIRLNDLPAPHGFAIHVQDEYLQWKVSLNLDIFSKPLVDLFSQRFFERRDNFQTYLKIATENNQKFVFNVDGVPISEVYDNDWNELEIQMGKSYYSTTEEYQALSSLLLDFMCLILFLLVEETEWSEIELQGEYEGDLSLAVVNKYERSRYNRAICLQHYGFKCRGCGETLQEKYGPLGAEVIHVHHIIPISQMGGSYQLNPIRDLIPLCPNCHNIVHRINPPLPIEQLHKLTGLNSSNF